MPSAQASAKQEQTEQQERGKNDEIPDQIPQESDAEGGGGKRFAVLGGEPELPAEPKLPPAVKEIPAAAKEHDGKV